MRRAAALVVAAGALFAAGFALAQPFPLSLTSVIGSTDASFAYAAGETVDFFCGLTVPDEPCGSSVTSGSTTYALSAGTYTFQVSAREGGVDRLSATTGATFTIAGPATVPPPSVSTTTVTTTIKTGGTTTLTVTEVDTVEKGGGVDTAAVIAIVVGFVGVLAATASWLTVRWRRRSGWQAKATSEEPPPRCVPPGHWCTKEVTAKPGRREIAYLTLAGQGPAARELGGRAKGGAADTLNEVVRGFRNGDSAEAVRLGVMPAAADLLDELRVQVAAGEGVAAVAAHLEGGKASCKFTVYKCVDGAWKERESWEVEIDDERDVPVAQVRLPLDDRSLELLVAELAGFVTRVDAAERR